MIFTALLTGALAAGAYLVPPGAPARADGQSVPANVDRSGPATRTATPSATPTTAGPTGPAAVLAPWAGRVADALHIPEIAVQAYGYAQLAVDHTDPSCHLSWTTLAAVGQIESQHGQEKGAVLQSDGRSDPPIVGPLLDGKDGRALVKDTDAGAFDGNAEFDRAMGPLQLMPSVWRTYGVDANNDGIVDPYNINDSSLALARLLCSGPEDLGTAAGWNAAMARYHSGSSYARHVFNIANAYGEQSKNIK